MATIDSARGRRRVVPGVIATVFAVLTCAVLTDHFMLQAEWWQVEPHGDARAAARRWPIFGPPAGPVTTSWQLTTPIRDSDLPAYDRVAYTLVDGELVIVSGHGLDVRDARTGRERWHYYRAQWSLLGWAHTGQVLVAYLERTGHRGNRLMVGLDAVSGTLLWRQRGDVPAATERTTLRWPAGDGVVIVTDDGRHTLYGRSATTGRPALDQAPGARLPAARGDAVRLREPATTSPPSASTAARATASSRSTRAPGTRCSRVNAAHSATHSTVGGRAAT